MIVLEHLRKAFPNSVPLKDVNVTVNDGEIVSIIGPSGTGKSVLLRCLKLLEKPSSGKILVDGEDITDPKFSATLLRRKIGMVF